MTSPKTDQPSPSINPYQAGRQEWLERYGDYIAQARRWRLTAMLALGVALASTSAVVLMFKQNQLVPYVVKVDRLGTAMAVARADRAEAPDQTIIVAQLARWIAAVRSVYVDAAAQRGLVKEAYAMINARGDAYGALNEHMRALDPFARARSETVSVEVETVLPVSVQSWRIEWREDVRSRDGARLSSTPYVATVNVSFNPPTDEAALRINPSGLYINQFHWSRRL